MTLPDRLVDKKIRVLAFVLYLVIFAYSIITGNALIGIAVILLAELIQEIKKLRFQRAIIHEHNHQDPQNDPAD